jgi:TfoX/Sxy family transcriptional regulator of competence genes
MFGGILGYVFGRAAISLSDIGLAFKLSPKDQDGLLAVMGAKRLQYDASQPISKTYIVVPEVFLRDSLLLRSWAEKCAEYVQTLPIKKK